VERAHDVPYDVQRFAHELWDDAVRGGLRQVDGVTLDATIIRLLGAQRPLLEGAWQRLTLAKRAGLRAAAHEGGRGLLAAPVRARYGLGPKSSVQRVLAGLTAEDWLTREADRYVFVDSLYRSMCCGRRAGQASAILPRGRSREDRRPRAACSRFRVSCTLREYSPGCAADLAGN
jgi:hypothetical protein